MMLRELLHHTLSQVQDHRIYADEKLLHFMLDYSSALHYHLEYSQEVGYEKILNNMDKPGFIFKFSGLFPPELKKSWCEGLSYLSREEVAKAYTLGFDFLNISELLEYTPQSQIDFLVSTLPKTSFRHQFGVWEKAVELLESRWQLDEALLYSTLLKYYYHNRHNFYFHLALKKESTAQNLKKLLPSCYREFLEHISTFAYRDNLKPQLFSQETVPVSLIGIANLRDICDNIFLVENLYKMLEKFVECINETDIAHIILDKNKEYFKMFVDSKHALEKIEHMAREFFTLYNHHYHLEVSPQYWQTMIGQIFLEVMLEKKESIVHHGKI